GANPTSRWCKKRAGYQAKMTRFAPIATTSTHCIGVPEKTRSRAQDNGDVQPERLPFHVLQVQGDTAAHRLGRVDRPAAAVHGRPASQAGLDPMAVGI